MHPPQSQYTVSGKNNVILIPPSIPRGSYLPMAALKAEDHRGEESADEEVIGKRTGRKRTADESRAVGDDNRTTKAFNNIKSLDPKDLSEYQRIERR